MREFKDKKVLNEKVRIYAIKPGDSIKRGITINILYIISGLLNDMGINKDVAKDVYSLIPEKIDNITSEAQLYIPVFLPSALLQYLGSLSDSLKNLERKYDDYSFFVHGYFSAHQLLTYTSILEYMVLCSETNTMLKIINEYSNMLIDSLRNLERILDIQKQII